MGVSRIELIDSYRILWQLHEIDMKALRTPRCTTHINMRAIRQCAGCGLEASRTASYGLRYAIIVEANSFDDSGTSYLFVLILY